jgi:hypothetical protein
VGGEFELGNLSKIFKGVLSCCFIMVENTNFKKVFLITMIVSLSIAALIGIIIFLAGSFGELEAKILFTTLAIGGFSLTALCSSVLYDRHQHVVFSIVGMIVAVIGFLVVTFIIWTEGFGLWKTGITLIILSGSIAQSSLLLLIDSRKTIVNVSLSVTLLFIAITATMFIVLVVSDLEIALGIYYRLLGVFAILDVLGTIVTPIILKVTSLNEPSRVRTAGPTKA